MRRRSPVFLARRAYRIRRRRDAARLLPLGGAFFFLLPVLWAPGAGEARSTALDGIYLFVVWAVLIIIAFVLSRGTGDEGEAGSATGPLTGPDEPAPPYTPPPYMAVSGPAPAPRPGADDTPHSEPGPDLGPDLGFGPEQVR